MSRPKRPAPAKLVASILGPTDERVCEALRCMEDHFGNADFMSPLLPFRWTAYYEPEMGGSLVRRFVAFGPLIGQDELSEIKIHTNEMERSFAQGPARTVNLDPGILTLERLVLATGKDFTHRVYLGRGIFADLTLVFRKKSFRPLPWTFPDYADRELLEIMNHIRRLYKKQLQENPSAEKS